MMTDLKFVGELTFPLSHPLNMNIIALDSKHLNVINIYCLPFKTKFFVKCFA